MRLTKISLFCLLAFIAFFISSCRKDEVTSITIDKSTLHILVGQTDTLFATINSTGEINKFPITWESSNSRIISVDGNGVITGNVAGTANIIARAGDKFVTATVTASSEINPKFTMGYLVYFGDTLHTTVSNLFLLEIRNAYEGIDIFVNADTLATDSLPSGEYSIPTSIQYITDLKPNTILPGYVLGYTTYFGESKSMYGYTNRPIESGSISVTAYKNGYYKINYVFKDVNRTFIYGIYNGPLKYYNYKKSAPQQKITMEQKLKGICTNNSIFRIPFR